MEARRAGRAARQMRSALRSFDYAQDKLMPREPAPATDRKWIPAFAGMTKCGRERPELNNVSRAAVDQRDSIHNARLIPPCIIGKMGEGLAPRLVGCFEPLQFFSKIMDGTIDNSSAFVYIL